MPDQNTIENEFFDRKDLAAAEAAARQADADSKVTAAENTLRQQLEIPDAEARKLAERVAASQAIGARTAALVPSLHVESVHQRARYFENLTEHLFAHIRALMSHLRRTGAGVPEVPHFPPLEGVGGSYDPNGKVG